MKRNTIALLVAAQLSCAAPLAAQDEAPPPALPVDEKPEEKKEPELQPGVLPEGTTAKARELWKALCDATLVRGMERKPVDSFRLTFDLRVSRGERDSHDLNGASFSFFAPAGFVRYSLGSGRENLRGPDGDFSIGKDGKTIKLEGRDFKEDRKQTDEYVRIARNFVALTDPSALRIAKLNDQAKAPNGLPSQLVKRASQLTWLEVVSPDFHLTKDKQTGKPVKRRMFRVLLGLDPATKRIDLAELREVGSTSTAPILIRFEDFRALDGYQVPHQLKFFELSPTSRPRVYREIPSSDFVLHRKVCTLAAKLKPADFRPRGAGAKH